MLRKSPSSFIVPGMDEIKIGHVIRRELAERRRTLKELSRETGIPYSTLHTWQENRQPKDIRKAKRLADHFRVTLHELLFDRADSHVTVTGAELLTEGRFEITVRRME